MNNAFRTILKKKAGLSLRTVIIVVVSLFMFFLYLIYLWGAFKYEVPSKSTDTPVALESGVPLRQTIYLTPGDTLKSIGIPISTYGRKNEGNFQVELYSDQTLIQSWKVKSKKLQDNQYRIFTLKTPLKIQSDSIYELSITHFFEGENQVAVWTNPDETSEYTLGEDVLVGSACFSLSCEKKELQNRYLIVSVIALLMLGIMYALKWNELAIMSCVLGIMLIAYTCVFPLGIGADEPHHFFRAFEIANGGMISKKVGPDNIGGDILPRAVYGFTDDKAEIDWNDTTEVAFQTVVLYSPLTYFPQALGIKVAGMLTNNVSRIYRGGIYSNALICLILCIAALYFTPFGRRALFVFMMFPMSLEQVASISPDGLAISLSVFFVSYVAHLSYKKKAIKATDIAVLLSAGMVLSLCKIVYIVLLLLVFLIPNEKFTSKANAHLVKFGLIVIAGILNLLWLKIASGFLIEFREGVNSAQQVKYVLAHPIDYCLIIARTFDSSLSSWIECMIGTHLGALNIRTAQIICNGFIVLFVATLCDSTMEGCIARKYDATILMLVFLLGLLAIISSLYVQWTAVAFPLVEGIQGRYFIPLMSVLSYSVILFRGKGGRDLQGRPTLFPNGLPYYVLMLCMNGMALVDVTKYVFGC